MSLCTVGILSPGEMGSAIGRVLRDNGLEVLTRLRARETGFREVPTYDQLVIEVECRPSAIMGHNWG